MSEPAVVSHILTSSLQHRDTTRHSGTAAGWNVSRVTECGMWNVAAHGACPGDRSPLMTSSVRRRRGRISGIPHSVGMICNSLACGCWRLLLAAGGDGTQTGDQTGPGGGQVLETERRPNSGRTVAACPHRQPSAEPPQSPLILRRKRATKMPKEVRVRNLLMLERRVLKRVIHGG